ncbi:MAG: HAMP domain-containing sensor histidine kinase [Bacteroidota bacterium]
MNSNSIKRVVLLGTMAIVGILVIQSYWVMQTWNLKEDEFHQTVKIALLQTANDLAEQDSLVLSFEDLINQRSSNYYVVNTNNHIHGPTLEYYLSKALIDHKLILPFEYGIYDCSSNGMVDGNYCEISNDGTELTTNLGDLPKVEGLTYYFGVRFPTRTSYMLGQMYRSVFFTILLLIAIFFFGYAIAVILRQKRLSEMQKDFINNMTHEFKTPISTIKISADVFANTPEISQNPRLQRYTEIIKEQNQRLNDQVEKVLQIARVEQDNFQLNTEKIVLADLINSVLNSAELKVQEQKGTLLRSIQLGKTTIQADRHHLTNVLHNLLDNAIKYVKQAPKIEVSALPKGEAIQLSIKDNGIGIKKEYQGKVFQKFYRIPTGNVHNVKGFGLGLFYIKNICEAHGWQLKLESDEGLGTTIFILIPFKEKAVDSIWSFLNVAQAFLPAKSSTVGSKQ